MSQATLAMLLGTVVAALGLQAALAPTSLVRRILAVNVTGTGVFLFLAGVSRRWAVPDPVPEAMILTGVVVAAAATALGLALAARLDAPDKELGPGDPDDPRC